MKDANKIIEEYRNYAVLHWNASREGDYRTANKNYAKLTKIYKILLDNVELREIVLSRLLNDSSFAVQLWAAAHSLGLGQDKDTAVIRLENISKMGANEAPSYEAKMTLQEWKEKGELIF